MSEDNDYGKGAIIKEFWEFLKVRKKWWLGPIVIILLLLGVFIILTEGSALAPFIYAIF
jgi:flagellar biosynthesis component FlhA